MELTSIDQLLMLKTRLRRSIIAENEFEKEATIVELKRMCFEIEIDNVWSDSRVVFFDDIRCEKSCEECVFMKSTYNKLQLIEV